mmetsp:Transcript_52256/g.124630  ORF Transcript_52256/g.124630 Transcript_52256/m.124630 type:complete len:426 (-) Transcript_52256:46-1323(-)
MQMGIRIRLPLWRVLLLGSSLARAAAAFAIVGYVPEYRFDTIDWDGLVETATHLVLFSVEPTANGEIEGMDRMWPLIEENSPLNMALRRAGENAPKLLLCVGGAGRSNNLPQVTASTKLRKKLTRSLSSILDAYPALAGIDIDWEAPADAEQWRGMGNLANHLRGSWNNESKPDRLLTMTFHPRSAATEAFRSMESKSGRSFAELFDMMHTMAYTYYDAERRHSTLEQATAAIDEFERARLPVSRLTLGVPFFGVSRRAGKTFGYGEILDMESAARKNIHLDELPDGTYFNNRATMKKKLELAHRRGLAGIMIWELGQDKPVRDPSSMLLYMSEVAEELRNPSWRSSWLRHLLLSEEQIFMSISLGMGFVLLFRVVSTKPAHQMVRRQPRPPAQQNSADNHQHAASAPEVSPSEEAAEDEEPTPS